MLVTLCTVRQAMLQVRQVWAPPAAQAVLLISPWHHAGAVNRYRPAAPASRGREAEAQDKAAGAEPQLLLHGCQVPGLLPNVSIPAWLT